ncbi:MAG: bifunctional methylenetetrahydrofolate dehydrogenase/methenyltetrahydrofolate cyclohydrolase FolD [Acidobacteriota bacterium]
MPGQILDGKKTGQDIQEEVKRRVAQYVKDGQRPPGLATVRVGEDPASRVYVNMKHKACERLGIFSERIEKPEETTTEEVVAIVEALNARNDIDGILVQLPLPPQVDEKAALDRIAPSKDVDGFHPVSVGNLWLGREGFVACTPAGIIELLKRNEVELKGKRAVIVGRSNIVGKPMAALLIREHATVTVCHSRTKDLAGVCRQADILVAAMGRPAFITRDFIREGAVVVDVGMNRVADAGEVERLFGDNPVRREGFEKRGYTLVGDVHPRDMKERASLYTPVPGGVGPLTIAMLMRNTLTAYERREGGAD